MTVEELLARESIRHTINSYNIYGDRLKEEFVDCFTDDAIFEFGNDVPYRYVGREEIRGWRMQFSKAPPQPAGVREAPKFVRHHLTTSRIEITGPDTAEGRSYFHVYTQVGPDHMGVYTDKYRKVGDRWLIAHRKIRTDWYAPNSLFRAPAKAA